MRWVYILKCEDDNYYVGETSRLYRRFWEHQDGRGGSNTRKYKPKEIVAIYKVDTIGKFIEYNNHVVDKQTNNQIEYNTWALKNFNDECDETKYNNLEAENNVVECLMMHNKKDWDKIIGGKYTRSDCEYKYPTNESVKQLPLCNCGLPCDIRKKEDQDYIFFRCAKKNMWETFKDMFEIEDEPCNFYMEYVEDIEYRVESNKKRKENKKRFTDLIKNSQWLDNVEAETEDEAGECVSCHTYVWCDRQGNFKNNAIEYNSRRLLLCRDCFTNKHEELYTKYNTTGKCLIKLKQA